MALAIAAACAGRAPADPEAPGRTATKQAAPGSARRPDPMPWVPTPSGEVEGAPTGEIAALAPGGRHSAARTTFLEFLRHALADDEEALVEMLAPSVGFLNRPQTMDRIEVARRIRSLLGLGGARELAVEELVDPRQIRAREVEASPAIRRSGSTSVVREGDLVVSAPRVRTPVVGPLGPFADRSTLSLALRLENGRYVVVGLEL